MMTIELAIQPTTSGLSSLELARSGNRVENLYGRQGALRGFDTIVVDHPGGALTNFDIAAAILRNTPSKVVLTHWAGVMEPQEAARQIAVLSRRSNGRLALRISPSGLGAETIGPGSSQSAWEHTDEYLRLLRRAWSNETPFDHEGPFYSLRGCYSPEKPFDRDAIPVWIDGVTQDGLKTVGRHADIVELQSVAPDEVGFLVNRIDGAAREVGRPNRVRFAFSAKPKIFAPTDKAGYGDSILAKYIETGVSTFILRGDVDAASLATIKHDMEQAAIVTSSIPAGLCGYHGWQVGGQL